MDNSYRIDTNTLRAFLIPFAFRLEDYKKK